MQYNETAAKGQASTDQDPNMEGEVRGGGPFTTPRPKAKKGHLSFRPIRKPSIYGKKSEQFISEW